LFFTAARRSPSGWGFSDLSEGWRVNQADRDLLIVAVQELGEFISPEPLLATDLV
jgi:hypothetical protein